jgi:hypothetical protein
LFGWQLLEVPTPKSVGHQDDKDILGTFQKYVFEVFPPKISPIPHGTRRLPSRRRGQTAVLRNSPYKRHLENTPALKHKFDRRVSCEATTRKGLGNVPNIKEKWSGKVSVTGDTSDEYEDKGSDSYCVY